MTRPCKTSLLLTALLLLSALTALAEDDAPRQCLTRHVRKAQAGATGQLPPTRIMTLNVVLPLRDQTGLDAFLRNLYDPASPAYRHFLTVAEFTQRFGPTQQEYAEVLQFAHKQGFTIIGGTRDGMNVVIKGPVSSVEKALHVRIDTYRHPKDNRTFYAPNREPSPALPFRLWHISGLDNYSIPKPRLAKRRDYPNAGVTHATTGSGPSDSFLGSDMRAAYYGGTSLSGAGQNLGLLEYVGTDLVDLNTYYRNIHQINKVPVSLVSTDGSATGCEQSDGCDDSEQTLDMTQALGMAPGLKSLVMYIGATDTAIISAMTTHNPLPTTIGCSWGWTPADPETLDPYFKKMAAQGQTFFAASGDRSTWSTSNEAWPSDDANVVSVGGTDLVTASAGGAWKSETAWPDSGGGISPDSIAIPSWQQISGVINSSNKGSTTLRNGPDVSANANFTFYVCANQTTCAANELGGTSFAAPMWAGYLALLNEQLATNGAPPLGFLNPLIYASHGANFHDVTSGTSGNFSAVPGYDLVTGWGSPNGINLINSLAPAVPATFSLSVSPSLGVLDLGKSAHATVTINLSGHFSAPISLSAIGQPPGVNVTFGPIAISASGTATSDMTVSIANAASTGTYPITIAGSGGGIAHTTTITLTVRL